MKKIAPFLVICALSAPLANSPALCPSASTVASRFHSEEVASGHAPAKRPTAVANNPTTADNNLSGAGDFEEWDATGSPDLYGNEIIDAVSKYKVDDDGALYELHSPETELPLLGSPVS